MKNAIIDQIRILQFGKREELPALDMVNGEDQGCEYNEDEFVSRAADLITGCNASQFEELARGCAHIAHVAYDDGGMDPAYAEARDLFVRAAMALRRRKGE